jgi:hypothetical protein
MSYLYNKRLCKTLDHEVIAIETSDRNDHIYRDKEDLIQPQRILPLVSQAYKVNVKRNADHQIPYYTNQIVRLTGERNDDQERPVDIKEQLSQITKHCLEMNDEIHDEDKKYRRRDGKSDQSVIPSFRSGEVRM